MARRLTQPANPVTLDVDGHSIPAQDGEPIACALIANDEPLLSRSIKYHRPRGAFCLTGGCAQCLMRVDGVPNIPTCRVPAKQGMRVERQNAFPDAKLDVLQAADFVFPKWFNHHEFLAGVPIAEKVMLKIARQLAGLGTLPDKLPPVREPAVIEHVDIVVVGAGAAGLGAAKKLTERNAQFVLLERDATIGGRLLSSLDDGLPTVFPANARTHATVVGLYADDGPPFLVTIIGQRVHLLFYKRLLLANGGHPVLPTFENNDLPGIYSARAVSTMVRRYGVLPGKRIAVVGDAAEARALSRKLAELGMTVVGAGGVPVKANGFSRVESLVVALDGKEEKLDCDCVALCAPLSPSFELARAAGARVFWEANHHLFVVEADRNGRTAVPNVFVAGELRGPMSANAAAEQGLVAAECLLQEVPR